MYPAHQTHFDQSVWIPCVLDHQSHRSEIYSAHARGFLERTKPRVGRTNLTLVSIVFVECYIGFILFEITLYLTSSLHFDIKNKVVEQVKILRALSHGDSANRES